MKKTNMLLFTCFNLIFCLITILVCTSYNNNNSYAINEKTSGIAELTKVHAMCEPEVIEYFKRLNEKYQINICKVDSSVDDNTQTISYTFEYSLEMKNGN